MAFERIRHFLDTFGEPRPPRPPIIPAPYRIPFYIALSVVSLLALIALIWFVVIPGVRSNSDSPAPASVPTTGSTERTP